MGANIGGDALKTIQAQRRRYGKVRVGRGKDDEGKKKKKRSKRKKNSKAKEKKSAVTAGLLAALGEQPEDDDQRVRIDAQPAEDLGEDDFIPRTSSMEEMLAITRERNADLLDAGDGGIPDELVALGLGGFEEFQYGDRQ